jgi:gas vesicle protein
MNDNSTAPDNSPNLSPLIGFALGALVGGTLALLLAPASGAKTRRRLGEAARQMGRDAGHSIDDARHTLEDARERVTSAATGLGADVKSALEAGREAFRHDGKPADGPGRRAGEVAAPAAPRTQ